MSTIIFLGNAGGTSDAGGIVIVNGHIIHYPGNNPEKFREINALAAVAKSVAEQAHHVLNAQVRQQMGEFAAEMSQYAAEGLQMLAGEKSSS